ncbi:MAG: FkbM family methyltransferase, partial [Proteobacteria bacterium]|nr:FkbM family methyltransferase [Pseudomonadota bacterium]NBS79739.1 FkbM family methyltransferase [bacterium]
WNAQSSLQSLIHQALKKIWLATRGIRPTACVPLASPNPGEQSWVISAERLPEDPLVYSLGLAENLSFDLGMIQQHGAVVHGFDPTTESQRFIAKSHLPAGFHFHPLAVAGHDGQLDLYERMGKGGRRKGASFLKSSCKKISTLVQELGHSRIDILKIDVEGSEYPILEDVCSKQVPVSQIAVEFHHRFEEVGLSATLHAHRRLLKHGYQLAHISDWAEEFLYIKRE